MEHRKKIPNINLNEWAFQKLHGNYFDLVIQGGRVVALFEPSDVYFELASRFNDNEPVPVMDYAHAIRQCRAAMMTLKETENCRRRPGHA